MSRCQLLCTVESLSDLSANSIGPFVFYSQCSNSSGPLHADEHECEHVQVYFDPSFRELGRRQRARIVATRPS